MESKTPVFFSWLNWQTGFCPILLLLSDEGEFFPDMSSEGNPIPKGN